MNDATERLRQAAQNEQTVVALNDLLRAKEARLAEAERDSDQIMRERDYAEDMADELAACIAALLGVEIGEHSSGNCPWEAALQAFNERPADSAPAVCPKCSGTGKKPVNGGTGWYRCPCGATDSAGEKP